MIEQTFAGVLDGVDVIILESASTSELKRISDQFASANKDVRMVMSLSEQATDQAIIAAFEATLPITDSYILFYPSRRPHIERNEPLSDPDVEPDSNYDLPRVVQSQIHLDVPYEFVESWERALQKAWQQCHPGSLLIVVSGDHNFNQILTQLQQVSHTTSQAEAQSRPRAVELDQDAINLDPNHQT